MRRSSGRLKRSPRLPTCPELNQPLPSTSIQDRCAAIAAIFTDPRNGRLPRTFVNRVWEKLMGRGFVADADDMDGEPWSPELLDYLAADFVKCPATTSSA